MSPRLRAARTVEGAPPPVADVDSAAGATDLPRGGDTPSVVPSPLRILLEEPESPRSGRLALEEPGPAPVDLPPLRILLAEPDPEPLPLGDGPTPASSDDLSSAVALPGTGNSHGFRLDLEA